YPEKEIIQINTREILLGGGNIHCMTMQIPTKL
ncbi:MAG: agmatine deiminase family protein, partial [Bacilli bacterium]|nr:agmatine deiminase family protein [Bacilli bacterium]